MDKTLKGDGQWVQRVSQGVLGRFEGYTMFDHEAKSRRRVSWHVGSKHKEQVSEM